MWRGGLRSKWHKWRLKTLMPLLMRPGLDPSISLLANFLTPDISLNILGAVVCFMPFVKFFVIKTFQEDLSTTTNLNMLVDP